MSHYVQVLDAYDNMNDSGNVVVPSEKYDEIKRRYITKLLTIVTFVPITSLDNILIPFSFKSV